MATDRTPDETPEPEREIEELLAHYVDRLNAGERLDPHQILAEQPFRGAELLEEIEAFMAVHPSSAAAQPLGTLGDYTLRRQVGRGGMGVVYDAWQHSMDRRVALKVLPMAVAADNRTFLRFMREARTAGQLNHPNVVQVHAMGVAEKTPYYAMEFVEGETLAQILARSRNAELAATTPFGASREEVAFYLNVAKAFAEVADGLQHAHARGVTHRDIKPSNLILDLQGRLRILDFGLAHLEGQESITASGDLVGTVQYMSPEQAQVRKLSIDHRTDIYSLGATLYEALTSCPPFRGKSHQDTLSQIIQRAPIEPRKINPRVPRDLETIVLKCLRKDPADRYGTAEALSQDLRRFVRGDAIEARPQSKWERTARWIRTHRHTIAVALTLIVLGACAAGLLVKERIAAGRLRMSMYYPGVDKAVQRMHFRMLTTRMGIERARRFDPGGYFIGEETPAGSASALLEVLAVLDTLTQDVPWEPDAFYHRARALLLLEREEEALRDLDRAIAADSEFVPAFVLRGTIFQKKGEQDRARQELEKAERSAGSAWATNLIAAYRAVDALDWEAAARYFTAVLAEETGEIERGGRERYVGSIAEMHMGRGMAHMKRGERGLMDAILDFGVARSRWRQALDPVLLLGEALVAKGERETAEGVFRTFHREAESQRRDEVALSISARLWHYGENEYGLAWADRIEDEVVRTRARIAHLYLSGRAVEAILEAEKVPAGLSDARFCGNLAMAWIAQEEWEAFETLVNKAIALEERYALMWLVRGALSASRGNLDSAQDELRKSLRCSEAAAAYMFLAETLFLEGERENAEAEFRKGEALFARYVPPAPRIKSRLSDHLVDRNFGALLEHMGRPPEALEQYGRVLEELPGDGWIHDRLAVLFRQERAPGFWEAVDAVLRAPLAAPEVEDLHPRQLTTMALAFVRHPSKGDAGRALECARLAVKKTAERDLSAMCGLAEVQEESGDLLGAVSTLEKAWALPGAGAPLGSILAARRKAVPPHLAAYETLDALIGDGGFEVLVPEEAEWEFLRGRVQPAEGWAGVDFDDSGWERGPGPLGYGLAYFCATEIEDMPGAYDAVYARKVFEVADPGGFQDLRLEVWADDGFVAYLNGIEVGRAGVEPQGDWDTHRVSPSFSGYPLPMPRIVMIDRGRLLPGRNCLALHGVNHPAGRQGFFLNAMLVGNLRPDLRRAQELLEKLNPEAQGPEGRVRSLYVEGRVLELAGNSAEAAEKLREVAALDPAEPLPHIRLARALRAAGRHAEAEDSLRSALPGFPDRRDVWDLWFETAAVDLARSPRDMLSNFGPEDMQSIDGYGGDVLWLLAQLDAGSSVRINCGGGDFRDSAENLWGRDRFFLGGEAVADRLKVGSPEDRPLHSRQRKPVNWGDVPRGYRIPLPPGEYRLSLRFCERHFLRGGHRVFAIRLEGEEVVKAYDPSGAGFATPDMKTWNVVVEDGLLDVVLVPRVGDPQISAIEVERVR